MLGDVLALLNIPANSTFAASRGDSTAADSPQGIPQRQFLQSVIKLTQLFPTRPKQCAHCHGVDGRGGINLTQRELDPKGIFQSIADGREKRGLRMPAWRDVMTDEEIWQATAYVMSISQQPK